VDHGANPTTQDKDGETALHHLVGKVTLLTDDDQKRRLEMITLLVNLGVDPGAQDNNGRTPLHDLVGGLNNDDPESRRAMVPLLIQLGANPEAQDEDGRTPLHYLVGRLYTDTVHQDTFLELLIKLLEAEMNINVQDKSGRTVLHGFAESATAPTSWTRHFHPVWRELYILLQYGADPTIQDKVGKLPLDYFKDMESFDSTAVFLLIQAMVTAGW